MKKEVTSTTDPGSQHEVAHATYIAVLVPIH